MRRSTWFFSILVVIVVGTAVYIVRRGSDTQTEPATLPTVEALRSDLELMNGKLVSSGTTKPFSGFMVEQYSSVDLPKSRSQIIDGRLNGVSEGWFTNQVLAVQEYFTNGVSHGLRTKWYVNGNKKSEAPIENGEINGTFRRWDEEGWLSQAIEMKNGKADGVSRAFFPSGFIKTEVVMREGEVVKRESWEDGEYRVATAGEAEAK